MADIGRPLDGKAIDLEQIAGELAAAGIPVPLGVGVTADRLHTYDAEGELADLPPAADAVIAAHQKPPAPPSRDERLLAAVASATSAVAAGGFTAQQTQVLQAVFNGLGDAIRGETP